jgi:hypothetical protein
VQFLEQEEEKHIKRQSKQKLEIEEKQAKTK